MIWSNVLLYVPNAKAYVGIGIVNRHGEPDVVREGKMEKKLTRNNQIYGDMTGIRGDVTGIRGDVTGISGDVTGISGDMTGIRGDVTGISGDMTGIRGNVTGIIGNIDECEISNQERQDGINIKELINENNH